MLLPEISTAPGEVWHRVAIDNGSGRVVGAIGIREDRSVPRWIVDVHVIAPSRGHGIARQLIETIAVEAANNGVAVLDAWTLPAEGSPQVGIHQKFGFQVFKRIFEHEAAGFDVLAASKAVYDRLVQRGGIPASARLISLKDADMDQVIALHTAYLGGTADGLRPRMGGNLIPFEPYMSLVLMVDDRVMGIALGHIRADPLIFEFDALVIHPSLRGGWASAWLRFEQCRRGLDAGCRFVRYMTFDQLLGERHSGKRTPHRLVQTTCWMRRTL